MRYPSLLACLTTAFLVLGCGKSPGDNPVFPVEGPETAKARPSAGTRATESNRYLWGIWKVRIDPDAGSVEVVPMRAAEMHLNAVRLLEVEPCADCLKISNVQLHPGNELSADLTLRHPYPGLLKLTGFDVRGVFISGADYTFPLSGRSVAWGEGLPRVLNADGYTALFNPTEFPETIPPALGYIKGKYAPGGDPSATLNPFLAYCKDAPRRMFWPGSAETRKVRVRFPDGPLEFGYAVDACWHPVEEVIDPVEDFPPEANCLEAYRIDVAIGSGLGPYVGSSVPVEVTVYDHQGFDTIVSASMEAPELFEGEVALDLSAVTGEESYLFAGTLTNELGAGEGDYPLLVRVIDTQVDPNLGAIDAWQVSTVSVGHKKGWARTWGGIDEDCGMGVAADGLGNVCVTGLFCDSVDFDPGPGIDEHSSNGDSDGFLSKFDSGGDFQWARTWGGQGGGDEAYAVATSGTGDVYVAGLFCQTVDFDPGPGVEDHTSNGDKDVFLTKFDLNGDFQWARTWGGTSRDEGFGVAADGSGSVYVTGYYQKTVDFDPGPGIEEHSSNGWYDIFLSKFDSSGEFQWTRTWGGVAADESLGVAADGSGNVYVTGYFEMTVDFDPGPGIENHASNGINDVFLSKFGSSGSFQWARTWGGSDDDAGAGVALHDPGSVYVAGWFYSDWVDFDPGTGVEEGTSNGLSDAWLSKFDSSGGFQWAQTWGGPSFDGCLAVVSDSLENVYVTGIHSALDADGSRTFLTKFDLDGYSCWTRAWGVNGGSHGQGATTDASDNVYVTGYFQHTVDFDPGPGVDNHSSNGSSDAFLSKFPPDGNW